jgi:hypothetical protein
MKKVLIPVLLLSTLFFTACTEDLAIDPKFNTLPVADTDITSTTATLKAEVLIVGNKKIIEYGFELSKSMIFSPLVTKAITGIPVLGVFQVEFTGLEPNTIYYYKAYALINTARVYSLNYEHFTTKL